MSASPDRIVAGRVGDRYEITGLIASGGMGSVYRARDQILDRTVALKVLKAGSGDQRFVARFRTEATNAARLSHPNIVQVYDFGYEDGTPYMAMEYVDGQTLREILQDRHVLPPAQAARIAWQVANALEYARRQGIVHRDIKPENILVTTEGQVKVADFGLSRALAETSATQSGVLVGTAHYLAPEQVEGLPSDHRADIYSLGVVLYEMLTGRPPFEGDSPVVVAYKRVAEDVPPPMSVNPSVPRDLDMVVARATARSPDGRYPTAGQMVDALRGSVPRTDTGELAGLVHHTEAIPLQSEETVAILLGRKGGGPRATKRRRRRRALALALIIAFVSLTAYAMTRPQPIAVPGVIGQAQETAESRLEAAGFDVKVVLRNDDRVRTGHVISQTPGGGTKLHEGETVQIAVSLGPALLELPDVRGKAFKTAERLLRERGFTTIRRKDVFDDRVKRLTVVSQDPDAGVSLRRDTAITLRVSKGPELLKVPDVVGDPEQRARDDLEAAGFAVAVKRKEAADVPAGRVISQDPKDGEKLARGETVTITVSEGPPIVRVPNLECMTRTQAADALVGRGLEPNFEGNGRRVVSQEPGPEEEVPKGSTIKVFMGLGSYC